MRLGVDLRNRHEMDMCLKEIGIVTLVSNMYPYWNPVDSVQV